MTNPGPQQWVAPPNWPQPPAGWSPPAGWTPDPAWGPAPEGWVWWQSAQPAHLPFWKAKAVGDTSPRFKKRMAWTSAVIVLLFVIGALGDDTPDTTVSTTAVAGSESKKVKAAPSPITSPAPPPEALPTTAPKPLTTDEMITQAKQDDNDSALALLGLLAVKGRAAQTGYDRELFGPAWSDTDRNGCDTRNDILKRDLAGETLKAGTRDCVVLTGTLADPYTGRTITFVKQDADAVHIDHVVSLSDAWQKGAQQWPAGKRLAFANDPLNLLAVDGPTNSSKSDGDTATWLPPHKPGRCGMVARQVAVKVKYQLAVTAAERDAMARVLTSCPAQAVPTSDAPTIAPVAPPKPAAPSKQAPPPAPAAPAEEPAPAAPAGANEYANCTELRKDYRGGVARQGAVNQGGATRYKPHYDDALYEANTKSDRDKDGIACEA